MTHILFADDDRLVLVTLSQGLRAAGFEVTSVSSGEEAVEQAETGRFDLALLDIRMGKMSGIEAARQLHNLHGLPVMFLTAYDEQGLVDEAVASCGLAYVMKPVDIAQLIPSIRTALARARDLQALKEARAQLEQALAKGRDTSIAIGIVMERLGLGEQAAFELLRANARSRQRKLNDYCYEIVDAAEQLNALGAKPAVVDMKPGSTQ